MEEGRLKGVDVLRDPVLNKGTAFTEKERDALKIRGLLPPRVFTQEEQVERVLENFRRKTSDLEKYIFLVGLQERNQRLFYRALMDNIEEMMPIVYTPTVGEACAQYAHIFRIPQGMYVSVKNRGRIAEILRNWPKRDVGIIVVTDGQRILGLGDLGANGIGIPIGKLSLYTACAGIDPTRCLPVMLDVGTDNQELLNDPLYMGLPQRRLRGPEYETFVDEFMEAAQNVFPHVAIQFEDFGNENAFRLLDKYKNKFCVFNDDIQGTAAVALAGLFSAGRITGLPFTSQRVLFFGAGEAAIGIADLIVSAMVKQGLPEEEARGRCWFVDSKGLVVAMRKDLQEHKRPYAHEHPYLPDVETAINTLRPTALIGVSGQAQTFTEAVLAAMSRCNDRPVVFALSNPTSKAECTAEQAYSWSQGRAVFASGSPFGPVEYAGKTYHPGQANNVYIFPGVGLGVVACQAKRIVAEMFYAAAEALAEDVFESSLEKGRLFPPLERIRELSTLIGARVAAVAYDQGLAGTPRPADLLEHTRSQMYEPAY
ncbi:MAG TPA: NAD-dependent malic enzyme [Candidatus Hydrogenedentes bacterium]|nr:NAD-dependent malic enzyme [Candidatus Hydrogenedentota bacterium]